MALINRKKIKYVIIFIAIIIMFAFLKINIFKKNAINSNNINLDKVLINSNIDNKNYNLKYSLVEESTNNSIDKVDKIEDINIFFNGKLIKLENYIYENKQRYYIEIEEALKIFSESEKLTDNNIIKIDNISLNLNEEKFSKNNTKYTLRGNLLEIDGKDYISINDLEFIFNLRSKWNYEEKEVFLFNEKEVFKETIKVEKNDKLSFIRLEDVTARGLHGSSLNIEKLKVIADYLYSQEIYFHIAWIPRFKDPSKSIDNDLLNNKSLANVQFINMLDSLIYKGGIIGLHGYTHQSGEDISGIGSELTRFINTKDEEVREIVESGIKTAKSLNIPIDFFETPHYHGSRNQQRIIEEYFDVIYEPYTGYWNKNPLISLSNNKTVYMPTQLSYVKDNYGEILVKKIHNNKSYMASLFIHPWKETSFINFEEIDENGYVKYTYEENTPIKNITKALKDNGYNSSTINIFKE